MSSHLVHITQQRQRIDDLFKASSELSPELSAHWSRYLCILISGFLESSIQAIYAEYARSKANENVSRYVNKNLGGFQNPNMQKISDLARSFNPEWAVVIEQEVQLKDSVNSIVHNRNQIAHGKSTDITIGRLKPWFQ